MSERWARSRVRPLFFFFFYGSGPPRDLHSFPTRRSSDLYAKPPFGGPEHVLGYLGRYTHRMAISNHRLTAFDGEHVSFLWRDYAHGSKQRVMTLDAVKFLRRFFLHVLPKGFVRIRHYGLLSNRFRKQLLPLARTLLAAQ